MAGQWPLPETAFTVTLRRSYLVATGANKPAGRIAVSPRPVLPQ